MEYLVCDTNIWYGIADGTINPETLKDYYLIGTAVSIYEMASTPMILSNFELVKGGIKALLDYHHRILKGNFYDHLICQFDNKYIPDYSTTEEILQEMLRIPEMNFPSIPQSNIVNTKERISRMQIDKEKLIAELNSKFAIEKRAIDDPKKKRKYKKTDFTHSNKRHIIALANDYLNRTSRYVPNITIDHSGWKNLEFFLQTWNKFFLMLDTQSDMKLSKNDLPDLFNLVYVQPGQKYVTRDSKWIGIFKQDPLLSNYYVEI